MAVRARLSPPSVTPPEEWPHFQIKIGSIPVSLLTKGGRRLEAESYLSSGFGIRAAIEARSNGWERLGGIADIWMPGRLKGIQVGSAIGTPFLAATQVFDFRPVPRKWLALARTSSATERFVEPGQILVTCSGSVGRPTIATTAHEGHLISHDLLRVDARDDRNVGRLYAFLHSPQARAMCTTAQYGHIIKHLEEPHLAALPVPECTDSEAEELNALFKNVLELRNRSHMLSVEAERLFESALGSFDATAGSELGFSVKASSLSAGRRRLDASAFNPNVSRILAHLRKAGTGKVSLTDAGYEVWVPGRYKRVPAEDGVIYRDSADILEVSPDLTKRFADCAFGDAYRGRVKAGWVLVPCSGQVYGIIGTAVLAQASLEGQVVSNHVIRIAPKEEPAIPVGYLATALGHPTLGRPLVKALAFGSSVPEISPDDLAMFGIVRLEDSIERQIDAIALEAARCRSDADTIELAMGQRAGRIIDQLLGGQR